jgi:hypothetical protein
LQQSWCCQHHDLSHHVNPLALTMLTVACTSGYWQVSEVLLMAVSEVLLLAVSEVVLLAVH